MPKTPRDSDDGPAVPVGLEGSAPTFPLGDEGALDPTSGSEVLAEASRTFADEPALVGREMAALRAAGEPLRADALACAQALRAAAGGETDDALSSWWAIFDRDPSLLLAFWGVRAALEARGAWQELAGVLASRIRAVALLPGPPGPSSAAPAPGSREHKAREQVRADLWLSHGRLLEDRLGRDEEAAQSYRAGLIEVPHHAGLLLALLLVGCRRGDAPTALEALTGLLRLPVPPTARATLTAAVARIERATGARLDAGAWIEPDAVVDPARVVGAPAALRALEILRGTLRALGPGEARPLVLELTRLGRSTRDPVVLADILGELVGALSGAPELVVALLRERARLLRQEVGNAALAREALEQALALAPGDPLVVGELADLADAEGDGRGGAAERATARLGALLGRLAPGDRPLATEAEQEVALRYAASLARGGRAGEGLAFLRRHPELGTRAQARTDVRADVEALELALAALAGDGAALAGAFDRTALHASAGEDDGAGPPGANGPRAAAHAHLVAGTLRERSDPGSGAPLEAYARAVAADPTCEAAHEALERGLWAVESWPALGERWGARLAEGRFAVDAETRGRLLEELVALHRDAVRDPGGAIRFQDRLVAPTDGRSLLRRLDLALAAADDPVGAGTGTEAVPGLLRALGDVAGTSAVQTALYVEAGWRYAARADSARAEELLRGALSSDTTGMAGAGLERLPSVDATGRAEIVRAELARRGDEPADAGARRALLFRLAHHLTEGGKFRDAVEALEPLAASGDEVAAALAWQVARRSGDAGLEVQALEATARRSAGDPAAATALGEARERTGDLGGAAVAYRAAAPAARSADAALGLLRIAALDGDPVTLSQASAGLAAFADDETRLALDRDHELLAILGVRGAAAFPPPARGAGEGRDRASDALGPVIATGRAPLPGRVAVDDEVTGVLGWVQGAESGDPISASAGLLALARALTTGAPPADGGTTQSDRDGLLSRASARSRLGGQGLAAAVHDQAVAIAGAITAVEVGLSDLPVAGRPARAAARVSRANRCGGRLGYALHLEVGLDAERLGDARGALGAFARAAALDPQGIEALDGIRRVALAAGDRRGAAQADMRLGAVLRTPARSAVAFRRAAESWRELGLAAEAKAAYWNALAREPASEPVFKALRDLLLDDGDHDDLERLLTLRLQVVTQNEARLPLLGERAVHRLERLGKTDAAIEDFKRCLKIDPVDRRALRALATLAMQRGCHAPALRFLERLVALEGNPDRRRALRLEMAEAHEAADDLPRAISIVEDVIAGSPLEGAAPGAPGTLNARQRMGEMYLRDGDWKAAVRALREWEAVLPDDAARAAVWIRMGDLQRDHGRDRRAAESAFSTAASLHPLGEGVFRLVDLYRAAADLPALGAVLAGAVSDLRHALALDPLDVPRLERLRELCRLQARGHAGDRGAALAVGAIGQLLGVLGGALEPLPGSRPTFAASVGPTFWARLEAPGAGGFAAEVWGKVARAVGELLPANDAKPPPRDKMSPGAEPRLAWIESAAAALGLSGFRLSLARRPEPADETVFILDDAEPALIVGRGALVAGAAMRFRVGRALYLLHARAAVIDRLSPSAIDWVFAAAASAVGAAPAPTTGSAAEEIAQRARQLARLMSRKEIRALELQASRFGSESLDPAAFHAGVLRTADRMGLVFAGDLPVALQIASGGGAPLARAPRPVTPRALDLVRFALSEDYPALRLEAGGAET